MITAIVAKSTRNMNEITVKPTIVDDEVGAVFDFIARWGELLSYGEHIVSTVDQDGNATRSFLVKVGTDRI